ncbi:UDP-N-acetylglucosamine--N-acetylmuramyl-(pentapeptide) pyrophosphoryl-undecaprenol N-acetylglucosamine transferase [Sulfurimonas sp. MAG313]|nr:UDP-N-acetylglucosamine--N-acetylmuramyl-(pentapeptide) pyrophosphoryl-undecaprenol N-acetylglucosamine transferase [Sulfurimonas sp. MAG313]MDF1881727.1 UDP-N-acetylglucosamine--N-acetylmuramyl-(pentapeptide) pyrophosphoryl-undecaprenol N-acetylglucosamine transferase [Sulfurimonas sp. MAG313]
MKLLITGGGTGGHLAIAKSLRDAGVKAGHECSFVGSSYGQDRSWFSEDTVFTKVTFLKTSGVVNKKGLGKIVSLFMSIKATFEVLKQVKNSDAVISVGGFSAAPASFAAVLLRKPYFIHEQNAAIGRLNRLLRPYSKQFFSSYEEDSLVKDYPVRQSFFKLAHKREKVKTIIFLGGSQGARFINDLALKIAPLLNEKNINIIHQAGTLEIDKVNKAYEELDIKAEVFAFRDDIDLLMQKSDLAVSRSGASTLWELCASCLPALYIPYPYASGDHQFYNAEFLVDKKASWIQRQDENPYELLCELIDKDLNETSKNLKELIAPLGAEKIIKEVEKC